MSTSGGPWSVKGIDPRAKARAKTAARKAGVTMGEWLNRVILDENGEAIPDWDEALTAYPGFGGRQALDTEEDRLLRSMVNRLADKVESSENLSTQALTELDGTINQLAEKVARVETDRLAALDEAQASVDRVKSAQDDLNSRVRALEASDTGSGLSSETAKAFETTLMKLARRLYQHENEVSGRFHDGEDTAREQADTTRRMAESFDERVKRLEERAADFRDLAKKRDLQTGNALNGLQEVTESLRRRVEGAERVSQDAARTLEDSVGRLDDRLRSLETRNSTDTVELERRFDRLSEEVARIVAQTRGQVANALGQLASESRVDGLEKNLTEALQKVERAELRQTDGLQRIGDEITRLAGAIDRRLTESEERTLAEARKARSEAELDRRFDSIREENEAALKTLQTDSDVALKRMGEEVSRMGKTLADRIARSEARSNAAMSAATDRVTEALERLERQRRSEDSENELDDRLRESETRTAERIETALAGVQDRMSSIKTDTENALTPVQRALTALADRLETIENRAPETLDRATPDTEADAETAADDFSTPLPQAPGAEITMTEAPAAAPAGTADSGLEDDPFLAAAEAAMTAPQTVQPEPVDAPILRAPQQAQTEASAASMPATAPVTASDSVDPAQMILQPAAPVDTAQVNTDQVEARMGVQQATPPHIPSSRRMGATADADFLAAARERTRAPGHGSPYNAYETDKSGGGRILLSILLGLGLLTMIALVGMLIWENLSGPAASSEQTSSALSQEALASALSNETTPAAPGNIVADNSGTVLPAETEVEEPPASSMSGRSDEPVQRIDAPAQSEPRSTPPTTPTQSSAPAEASPVATAAAATPPAETAPIATAADPGRPPVTLESAASDGNPVARYMLGANLLEQGNTQAAAILLRRAAEQGIPAAQYRYGILLEDGEGVDANVDEARQWVERAANSGHRRAMYRLGVMYHFGRGTERNDETAARWFEEASLLGLADAQFNLAMLFERGQGVPQSPADAFAWYTIAAAGGDTEAAERARIIGETLPQGARDEAGSVASGFQPRPIDPEANGLYTDQPWDRVATADPEMVRRAQGFLSVLGYQPGTIDGMMGDRTRTAIRQFQADNAMPRTGRVDTVLLDRLEQAVAG
ncbi:peptidoglycan-binding protein [Maricaulis sp. D1M11]|uniref:peptidoglycan-binding protein n=1 Tax=Maricaulis sp. D1M11 TaxID=3076117 RepID=UPI0039B3A415